MRLLLALTIFMLSPAVAFAHTGAGEAAGFLHGLEHPLGGMDHVLAMVAVGILAVVLGGRALVWVPLGFVAMMVVGFLLGLAQVPVPSVELGIALSSIVIGALAAWGKPMPSTLAVGIVSVFAIFHGHAHGAEMPDAVGGLTYALGFGLATTLLHLSGIAAAMGVSKINARHGRLVARIAGGVFAMGGVGVLAGWL